MQLEYMYLKTGVPKWKRPTDIRTVNGFESSPAMTVIIVLDPGKEVCADPVDGGAILGRGEPDPHSRDKERQLAPDKGRGKT